MFVKRYKSRNISGKLKVSKLLRADPKLRSMIPHTESFHLNNLSSMVKRFKKVYIKPNTGSQGIGIFNLTKKDGGLTLKEIVNRKQLVHHYRTVKDAYHRIKSKSSGKMIIQKAIKLDKVNGKPYDIRAMVQRMPGGSWTFSGFLVKVGAKGKIVTNYYQGGVIYTLRKLGRKQGLSASRSAARKRELTSKALKIAKSLSKHHAGMHEMGIDFAYDKRQHLWVLEVNSNHPQFRPLKKLDPKAYAKMKRFARSYGRKDD
ncbi:YheC/YheD family protein [Paenibacillus harenae]|uniref:Glutathione synthase/RimK-type ligase-like ATP-grasp enzyme n=1 Tax=Paenibacillus harenae TaxID=306543 RepID=A0ABT9U6K9_PAEHA|nr:YheC/YheD family protein [Paenibacillus harenae]MDQ0115275.1 glutathione synthase/RimK-type ligase-like ATP-grasp enzyme [Paenibacillus harenae]